MHVLGTCPFATAGQVSAAQVPSDTCSLQSAVQIWRTVAIGSQDLPFGYGLGTQDPYEHLKMLKIVQQTEKYFLVLQVLYQALPGAF